MVTEYTEIKFLVVLLYWDLCLHFDKRLIVFQPNPVVNLANWPCLPVPVCLHPIGDFHNYGDFLFC